MTLDEAINILKQYVDYDNPDVPDFYTMAEAIEVVIKSLEQEPVLDKIRAEIKREWSFRRLLDEYDIATGLQKALSIIDNYMAEGSDKE